VSLAVVSANPGLVKEFSSLPSSSVLWKSLRGIGINSSLNGWKNSAVKSSGSRLSFDGRLNY
jgi:hypothetical protein